MNIKFLQGNKGYTLLFSIIVASVVLSMAAFILSVSRKQFILTSAARDSTIAIYAADSGMQCITEASGWESRSQDWNGHVSTSSGPVQLRCSKSNGLYDYASFVPYSDSEFLNSGDYISYKAGPIQVALPNNTCARLWITDGYDPTTRRHKVVFESRGYNIADSGPCAPVGTPAPANPRAVERAIRMQYNY